MAGIQEIDEYPRVLSDAGMIPRNHQVVETTADYNWLDRIINWGRAKIGMEPRPARIIYSLERKPPKDKGQPGFNEDPQPQEQPVKKKRFGRKLKRKKGRVLMQAEPATETYPYPPNSRMMRRGRALLQLQNPSRKPPHPRTVRRNRPIRRQILLRRPPQRRSAAPQILSRKTLRSKNQYPKY